MAVAWSISRNGAAALSLEAWGIRSIMRDLQSLAVSELRFTIPVADVLAAAPFAFGDIVRLFRDGVCWFVGTVSLVSSTGAPDGESFGVTVSDAWWNFERRIYQQLTVTKQGNPPTILSAIRSSRVVLGKDPWGVSIPTDAVLLDIISQSGLGSSPFVPSLIQGYYVEARDISLAEAIRRMLAITPDCVGWFDYSSGDPVFYIRRRANLTPVAIDLNETQKRLESFSLTPRSDLLMRGVVINYITTKRDDAGADWLQYTIDSAGAITGDAVIFTHIELAAQGTERPEPIPLGLAANYFSCYNVLQWEGSLVFHEADCSGPCPLGSIVNLANGQAAWASMNAVVAGVSENLINGTTEVALGPPPGLALGDFIDLMRNFRNRPPGSDFPAKQDNGTEGVPIANGGLGAKPGVPPFPNPNAGKPSGGNGAGSGSAGNHGTESITHCVAGVEKTSKVLLA